MSSSPFHVAPWLVALLSITLGSGCRSATAEVAAMPAVETTTVDDFCRKHPANRVNLFNMFQRAIVVQLSGRFEEAQVN